MTHEEAQRLRDAEDRLNRALACAFEEASEEAHHVEVVRGRDGDSARRTAPSRVGASWDPSDPL